MIVGPADELYWDRFRLHKMMQVESIDVFNGIMLGLGLLSILVFLGLKNEPLYLWYGLTCLANAVRADRRHGFCQLRLNLQLQIIRQFKPVRPEEFDAIVIIRIVAGTDDDTGPGAERTGQVRHGRCRHGAEQPGIDTGG